jgi:hypothetical protein
LAGYDPDYVRTKAKALVAANADDVSLATPTRIKGTSDKGRVVYDHDGKSQTIAEWADELGLTKTTLYDRLRRGWTIGDAVSFGANTKPRGKGLEFNGRTQSLTSWAKEYGVPFGALFSRVKRGWPIEAALTTPISKPGRPAHRGHPQDFEQITTDRMSPTAQDSI